MADKIKKRRLVLDDDDDEPRHTASAGGPVVHVPLVYTETVPVPLIHTETGGVATLEESFADEATPSAETLSTEYIDSLEIITATPPVAASLSTYMSTLAHACSNIPNYDSSNFTFEDAIAFVDDMRATLNMLAQHARACRIQAKRLCIGANLDAAVVNNQILYRNTSAAGVVSIAARESRKIGVAAAYGDMIYRHALGEGNHINFPFEQYRSNRDAIESAIAQLGGDFCAKITDHIDIEFRKPIEHAIYKKNFLVSVSHTPAGGYQERETQDENADDDDENEDDAEDVINDEISNIRRATDERISDVLRGGEPSVSATRVIVTQQDPPGPSQSSRLFQLLLEMEQLENITDRLVVEDEINSYSLFAQYAQKRIEFMNEKYSDDHKRRAIQLYKIVHERLDNIVSVYYSGSETDRPKLTSRLTATNIENCNRILNDMRRIANDMRTSIQARSTETPTRINQIDNIPDPKADALSNPDYSEIAAYIRKEAKIKEGISILETDIENLRQRLVDRIEEDIKSISLRSKTIEEIDSLLGTMNIINELYARRGENNVVPRLQALRTCDINFEYAHRGNQPNFTQYLNHTKQQAIALINANIAKFRGEILPIPADETPARLKQIKDSNRIFDKFAVMLEEARDNALQPNTSFAEVSFMNIMMSREMTVFRDAYTANMKALIPLKKWYLDVLLEHNKYAYITRKIVCIQRAIRGEGFDIRTLREKTINQFSTVKTRRARHEDWVTDYPISASVDKSADITCMMTVYRVYRLISAMHKFRNASSIHTLVLGIRQSTRPDRLSRVYEIMKNVSENARHRQVTGFYNTCERHIRSILFIGKMYNMQPTTPTIQLYTRAKQLIDDYNEAVRWWNGYIKDIEDLFAQIIGPGSSDILDSMIDAVHTLPQMLDNRPDERYQALHNRCTRILADYSLGLFYKPEDLNTAVGICNVVTTDFRRCLARMAKWKLIEYEHENGFNCVYYTNLGLPFPVETSHTQPCLTDYRYHIDTIMKRLHRADLNNPRYYDGFQQAVTTQVWEEEQPGSFTPVDTRILETMSQPELLLYVKRMEISMRSEQTQQQLQAKDAEIADLTKMIKSLRAELDKYQTATATSTQYVKVSGGFVQDEAEEGDMSPDEGISESEEEEEL